MRKNEHARAAGIPKAFRQYMLRYGRGGIYAMLQKQIQVNAPKLDHWRDRGNKFRAALGLNVGERSEWR